MTVFVLLVAYFLSGGSVLALATLTYSKSICESAIDPLAVAMTGRKYKVGDAEETIIDVQGQCIAVTRHEHI